MAKVKEAEIHVTSASAFTEGGIQDACDDACSICLEDFSDSDPSTVTTCKHEFHLQCVLEWCQRSSNCPMCWQSIRLKDLSSQELLAAVEQERIFRSIPSRNTTVFRRPALGDVELQHLAVGLNEAEFEERIIQHFAAAAAMRRSHHGGTREDSRSRSSAHARPQFVVLSVNTHASSTVPISAESETISASSTETNQSPLPISASPVIPSSSQGIANDNGSYLSESSSQTIDGAGPSASQSFSDMWRSRLSLVSMKYRESISRNTRGWTEKLFSRSTSVAADIGCEVRREINAGIATVNRMMERIETRHNNRENSEVDSSVMRLSNRDNRDGHSETPSTSAG